MKGIILIRCIAAAAEQFAAHGSGAVGLGCAAGIAVFTKQPGIDGVCSVCGAEALSTSIGAGNIWNDNGAYLSSGRCPYCWRNTVHLGCALSSLSQVKCHSCGRAICHRFDELDALIEKLREGTADSISDYICHYALIGLESMEHSLIALTLRSYDPTADDLELLENFIGGVCSRSGMGMRYPGTMYMIDCIKWIKSIAYMQADRIITSLANVQTFDIALPMLDIAITPYLIAEAGEGQIIALIMLLAGYKGASPVASDALVMKIVDLADIAATLQFGEHDIRGLLCGMISSGNCAMIRHLVGRRRFGHKLEDDSICSIIEQYAASRSDDDRAFMPLLVFLLGGDANRTYSDRRILRLSNRLLERNSSIAATWTYMKIRAMAEKCESGTTNIEDAIANYSCAPGDKTLYLDEDLFCAIITASSTQSVLVRLAAGAQDVRAAHIMRHIPLNCSPKDTMLYIEIARQAAAREDFAVLEEMYRAFMCTRQPLQNACNFFDTLLKSNCRDYMGLVLKSIGYNRLRHFKKKKTTDWLLEQIVEHGMYWCIPYLRRHINNRDRYDWVVGRYHRDIMDTAVAGRFRFSPAHHGMVRCDARNAFFVENFLEYLEALLRASTERHAVQRLLIEMCQTQAFKNTINETKIAAVHELFRAQHDYIFYLDAFYHALRYPTQKNCLKIFIMKYLEKDTTAKNQWAAASINDGLLKQRLLYRPCSGYKCIGTSCKYCEIVSCVKFEDLVAALRYAHARANK